MKKEQNVFLAKTSEIFQVFLQFCDTIKYQQRKEELYELRKKKHICNRAHGFRRRARCDCKPLCDRMAGGESFDGFGLTENGAGRSGYR